MTNKPKHTPGEWIIKDTAAYKVKQIVHKSGRALATVYGNTPEEVKANGSLIAVAPRMLGYLKMEFQCELCGNNWEKYRKTECPPDASGAPPCSGFKKARPVDHDEQLDRLEALIAKAEGEE